MSHKVAQISIFENLSLVKGFSERCRMKLRNAQTHGIFPHDIRETLAHVLNLLRDTFSSLAMGS